MKKKLSWNPWFDSELGRFFVTVGVGLAYGQFIATIIFGVF